MFNNASPEELPFISVVIPVYNAEEFISKAVESALSQPQTAEVILVEDASSDNSYEICQSLTKEYDRVHLFTHKDHINKGAGASRNLGIKKTKFEYIAFLDADDFYLDNRFSETMNVLRAQPDADGVYEAIGVHFHSENEEERWNKRKGGKSLTTIEDNIKPDELFWHQTPIGSKGYTSLDGLTVKKSVLEKVGLFNPDLRLHQDTDLFIRLAMACSLFPGNVKSPVAMRGIHENNRITRKRPIEEAVRTSRKMMQSAYQWALGRGYTDEANKIKQIIIYYRIRKANSRTYNDSFYSFSQYLKTMKEHPEILLNGSFYVDFSRLLKFYIWSKVKKLL
jgi:glycosyltransferase involved in cell wall biosynthesis